MGATQGPKRVLNHSKSIGNVKKGKYLANVPYFFPCSIKMETLFFRFFIAERTNYPGDCDRGILRPEENNSLFLITARITFWSRITDFFYSTI